MTSFSLSLGCALLAFSPTLSLLLLLTYSKAQLVIIVTTSSFFQLLSCLLSALLHLPFKGLTTSTQDIFVVIPTSVLSQAFFRSAFVYCYHKVEAVIEKSIQRHEQQEQQQTQTQQQQQLQTQNSTVSRTNHNPLSETTQLKLELNDVSAGVAAGVGFGFFHTVMLYGTLLASENSRIGTLYQDSCTVMPSIFNSAIMAFCFGILDLVWMLLTFYGMRRIKEDRSFLRTVQQLGVGVGSRNEDNRGRNRRDGGLQQWTIQRDHLGGKSALVLVLLTHFAAAFATLPNQTMPLNGCIVALPSLAVITILTVLAFGYFCKKHYLPREQQQRIQMARRVD